MPNDASWHRKVTSCTDVIYCSASCVHLKVAQFLTFLILSSFSLLLCARLSGSRFSWTLSCRISSNSLCSSSSIEHKQQQHQQQQHKHCRSGDLYDAQTDKRTQRNRRIDRQTYRQTNCDGTLNLSKSGDATSAIAAENSAD